MEAKRQETGIFEEDGRSSGPITLPTGAKVERDVAYGADPAQRMDIYLPQHATGPVLFMVHGGAWMLGDKATDPVVKNKVSWLLSQGIIFVSVNYRLSPKADPLEQASDVAQALAFAQSKANSWRGDADRFVVMGHSAGAHLVSLLASDSAIGTRHGTREWLGTVALDSQAFDVVKIMQTRHYRFYDKVFKADPDFWREASPIHRLKGPGAPMLLVCSSSRENSCAQAQDFAAKATASGRQVSVLPLAMKHGDINKNLGLAGDYTDAVDSFFRSLGIDYK